MKFLYLGALLSAISLQAVEIVNNTNHDIELYNVVKLTGPENSNRPHILSPGKSYAEAGVNSFEATIEENYVKMRLVHDYGLEIRTINKYTIPNVKDSTQVTFVRVSGIIDAHKVDKQLPYIVERIIPSQTITEREL